MIAKLLDAWLTNASERSYEAAFAQLLLLEGYRVIQGPLHHGHEHGKDIIAMDQDGKLQVYQLKGGRGKLNKAKIDDVQSQLHTASLTAVTHPALARHRRPDRVVLVTNQDATPPAQSHLANLSVGNVEQGLAPIVLIERSDLVSRFLQAQSAFAPENPAATRTWLDLFLRDGNSSLPVDQFFDLVEAILPADGMPTKAHQLTRLLDGTALAVWIALQAWVKCDNHVMILRGWVVYCIQLLRVVEAASIAEQHWKPAMDLAMDEIRHRASLLITEAAELPDLICHGSPDEALVYPMRVMDVCGIASALVVSDKIRRGSKSPSIDVVRTLMMRELDAVDFIGEAQGPAIFLMTLALGQAGQPRASIGLLFNYVAALAKRNQLDADDPLPNPYWDCEKIIRTRAEQGFVPTSKWPEEQFGGLAYTLHIGIRWLARKWWRHHLSRLWYDITGVRCGEWSMEEAGDYLVWRTRRGVWREWSAEQPTCWRKLLRDSQRAELTGLPESLCHRKDFLPFYCLIMPHRFDTKVSDLLLTAYEDELDCDRDL